MPDDENPLTPPVPPTDPVPPPDPVPPSDPVPPTDPIRPPWEPPLPPEPPLPVIPGLDGPESDLPPAPDAVSAEILPAPLAPRAGIPKAAIIGALLAVTVAVAAVAVVKSVGSDGAADIATVVPADVLGFVRISVEPSGTQRADLRRLLGKLSAEKRTEVIAAFDKALADLIDIPGGDFDRDVRPWLGAQVAVAAYAGGGEPALIGVFGVRDEALARAFYAKHAETGDPTLEIVDGVGYVAKTAEQITAFRNAATTAPLSEDAGYKKELGAAGGDGLVVVWVNGDQIGKHATAIAGILGGVASSVPGLSASAGSGVFVLRAEADGIAFVGHQSGGPTSKQKPGRPRLLEGAPDSVLGGISLFDIKGSIEQFAATAAGAGGADPLAAASGALGALGLDLQKDVLAWLGGEVAFVATPLLEFGVIADVTDEAAYRRTVAVLPALAPALGGTLTQERGGFTVTSDQGAFSVRKGSGKVALGFAQTAQGARALAQQLLGGRGATLGDSAAYRAAFGATVDTTVFQVFVNLKALQPFLASLGGDPGVLASFEVGAARVTLSDGGSDVRFVLTLRGE